METRVAAATPRRSATAMRGLRQMRKRAGLTQEQLAADLGVTRQTVISWEAGAAIPAGVNLLEAMCARFGCTVGALFDGEEAKTDDGSADQG